MSLAGYYDRFNPQQGYEKLLFRAARGLQSAELNEMQSVVLERVRSIGDALFRDGDIVQGADIVVDPDSGSTSVSQGLVYIRAGVREVPERTFAVPTAGIVTVGVWYVEETITEIEDPGLRDPAVGTRNYQEPGAGRLRISTTWGYDSDGSAGQFFPVYTVENGVLQNRIEPPQLNAVIQAIARYDREANGSYVVSGLSAQGIGIENEEQVISVSEGVANINGFKVDRPNAQRLRLAIDPTLQMVSSEPKIFLPNGDGAMRVETNRAPIAEIIANQGTIEISETVTRGPFSGGRDPLVETAVVQIVSVTQGGASYLPGTDYIQAGDEVDWSPTGGAEPAPGSSYTVVYRYIGDLPVDDLDPDGFTTSGAVAGTTVLTTYRWMLPRIDALALSQDGELRRIKGNANANRPAEPPIPSNQLLIAYLDQDWRGLPRVRNDAVRAVPVSELEEMNDRIDRLFNLVAIERLRTDVSLREPSAKAGVFVDPFLDDDLRDQGVPQTAAIFGGVMTLPIAASVVDAPQNNNRVWTIDYDLVPVVEQLQRSGSMKINPYMSFEPIPASVRLEPAVDQWTIVNTLWASDITRRFVTGGGWGVLSQNTQTEVRVNLRREEQAEFLRVRDVGFEVEGFGPSERLVELTFDGIDLTPDPEIVASGNGLLSGSFSIPPDVPSGSKAVTFRGHGGSFGEATYIGRGLIITEERQRILTTRVVTGTAPVFWDPLAQTFVLRQGRHVGAIDVWFAAKGGTAPVICQLRTVENGIPTSRVLAETAISHAQINLDPSQHTRFVFDNPPFLEADTEYAFVIATDDADHALRIAELGKFDPTTGWITAQPYTVGVLLSSSNARTWTPQQTMDLTFRIHAARFTSAQRTISLGDINAAGLTDLIPLAGIDRPTADTEVDILVSLPDGTSIPLVDAQVLSLGEALTGQLSISAVLRGSETSAPILFPGTQAILGSLSSTGTYVSRAFPCGTDRNLTVVLEANTPGTSGVSVQVLNAGGNQLGNDDWTTVPFDSGEDVGDGWSERSFRLTSFTADFTRIRIVLSGSALHRPFVRRLRAIVT